MFECKFLFFLSSSSLIEKLRVAKLMNSHTQRGKLCVFLSFRREGESASSILSIQNC